MLKLELLAVREFGVNGMSVCLKPRIPVVITPGLVNDIRQLQNSLAEKYLSNTLSEDFYVVWFLEDRPGLSWHGWDFNFIVQCFKKSEENKLENYICGVFDLIFLNRVGLGFPVINCSIVSRSLTGLSKEFFFLNKICFIHNSKSSGVEKVPVLNELNPLLLERELYEKNHYFYFDSLRVDKMREVIEEVHYEVPTTEEVNLIKSQFELMKSSTMLEFVEIASRNIKILERRAHFDLKCYPQHQ